MQFNEIKLTEFSELLSNATGAAKMSQSAQLRQAWDLGEAGKTWAKAAEEISSRMRATHGREVELARRGHGDAEGAGPSMEGHPLVATPAQLKALRKAIKALPAQALDQAALEVAKHLATPFERAGVAHLAFQQERSGLKAKKTAQGMELAQWSSSWPESAQSRAPELDRGEGSGLAPHERAAPALEELARYWRGVRAFDDNGVWRADTPDLGVHAGGRLASSSASEYDMPSASWVDEDEAQELARALAPERAALRAHISDPAGRRLGWLAIALLLGDRPSAEQAASGHGAPAMDASFSVAVESTPREGKNGAKMARLNGKARADRPAICAMQSAVELAVFDYDHGENGARSAIRWLGYRLSNDRELSQALAWAREASKAVEAAREAASIIMAKAYDRAREIQEQWLSRHGFGQALADARQIEGELFPSVKSINWALAHPQAGQALGSGSPSLAFASATSRYLGGDAPLEAMEQAARQAWEPLGLSAKAFDAVASFAPAKARLMGAIAQEMASPKRAKAAARLEVQRACARMTAAFEEGASPEEAMAFDAWCQKHPEFFGAGGGGLLDGGLERVEAQNPSQARSALATAQAKQAAHPWALRSAFRAHSRGEGFAHEAPERWADLAARALADAGSSARRRARWQWSKVGPSTRWVDLARGAQGPFAGALIQAEQSGAHGQFAARVAAGLGIEEALDGNDVIAKTREELKNQWGVGAGAWKALGQASPSEREAIAQAIEKRREAEMDRRAAERLAREDEMSQALASIGLGLDLLGWQGQHGVSPRWSEALSRASREKSESWSLLSPGTRSIDIDSVESAQFALAEMQAKRERLPRIVKSLAERLERFAGEAGAGDEKVIQAAAMARLENELRLVDDWLRSCEDGVWQTLPAKASFGDLWRRQAVWHEEVALEASVGKSKAKWPSPMESFAHEGWEAQLLSSSAALTEEGRAMRHCVSSYASRCKEGTSRIFSVKLNGERVCTMELGLRSPEGAAKDYKHGFAQEQDQWEMLQNKGHCNAQPPAPARLFCEKVLSQMNQAHAKWALQSQQKRSEAAKKAAQKAAQAPVLIGEGLDLQKPDAPKPTNSPPTGRLKPGRLG